MAAKKIKKNTGKRQHSKRRKNKKHGRLLLFLKLCGAGALVLAGYLLFCLLTLPDINEAVNRTRLPSTTIIAANGNEVQSFGTVYSEIIPLMPLFIPKTGVFTIISALTSFRLPGQ